MTPAAVAPVLRRRPARHHVSSLRTAATDLRARGQLQPPARPLVRVATVGVPAALARRLLDPRWVLLDEPTAPADAVVVMTTCPPSVPALAAWRRTPPVLAVLPPVARAANAVALLDAVWRRASARPTPGRSPPTWARWCAAARDRPD